MKIAFVSQAIDNVNPPYQSSIGIWTDHISRRLGVEHEVLPFAKRMRTHGPRGAVAYFLINALPNRIWLLLSKWLSKISNPRRPFVASIFYNLEYVIQIALACRFQQADIVHIHNFTQFVPVVRAFNPRARIVLHMHSEWLSQFDRNMLKNRVRKADLILGCSDHITEEIRKAFPEHAEKCHTLHNGVDLELFEDIAPVQEKTGPPVIAFLGRISPEKGVHVLLEAYKIVREKVPDVRLKLIGSGGALPLEFLVHISNDPQVASLEKLYDEDYVSHIQSLIPAEAKNDVVFTGPVSHQDVKKMLADVDVLVNPSFSESFGMSLVEAMALKIPVVAAHVGGMKDIVEEGETGFFVPVNDARALAKAILALLENASLRKAMGESGRKHVEEHFSWDHIANRLLELYSLA